MRLPIHLRSLRAYSFGLVLVRASSLTPAQAQPAPDDQRIVVRITDAAWAVPQLDEVGVDVWESGAGVDVIARVSPAQLLMLDVLGLHYTVEIDDVYRWLAENAGAPAEGAAPWTTYHNLASADAMLAQLAADNPDICALEVLGQSIEGRDLYALRISDDAATVDPSEPAVYINGCHHAREWIAVEMPLYIADQLVARYHAGDAQVRRLVNYAEVWITAVVNPDGFLYSEQVDRFWRKNRRPNSNGSFGVDLNRNYSYQWGGPGSSGNPSSGTYRGTAPFSEPESAAIRDMIEGGFGRSFDAALDYHSFGQLVMHSWGYTLDPPSDAATLDALTSQMAAVINAHDPSREIVYTSGQSSTTLYIASGVSTDWYYGEHGLTSVIIELRPEDSPPGFVLPEDQLLPTVEENLPGALYYSETTLLPPIGDADEDGSIDLADFALLPRCLGGPIGSAPAATYAAFDADGDNHIDLRDVMTLVSAFTG